MILNSVKGKFLFILAEKKRVSFDLKETTVTHVISLTAANETGEGQRDVIGRVA